MPLQSYGVLAGRAVASRREGGADTPHYQIHLQDAQGTDFRVAVNVMSQQSPSELLYLVDDDFTHPILDLLPGDGWTALPAAAGGANLDFIRGNLFDRSAMRLLPPDAAGPDNDLADLLDHYVGQAVADPAARIHAFGERWPTEATVPDKVFGFLPGNGVHDIHMNQGNSGAFRRDDGVWQDGGLLLHFPDRSRFVAVFLAFQSQIWHTDDQTGHALGDEPGQPLGSGDGSVRIVGALVNPAGPAPEAEAVTLLNASPAPVDLTGWRVADRMKRTCPVPGGRLAAGASVRVPLGEGVQLGNGGGTITVLDPAGLKVDGVAYTGSQAAREGWTLVF
ncbi:MAG TPA: DUF2278 family protein [Dermatophilaceae bacterium]|nr:DUF2278 family protein [Dermatophilaceae bacterium]